MAADTVDNRDATRGYTNFSEPLVSRGVWVLAPVPGDYPVGTTCRHWTSDLYRLRMPENRRTTPQIVERHDVVGNRVLLVDWSMHDCNRDNDCFTCTVWCFRYDGSNIYGPVAHGDTADCA